MHQQMSSAQADSKQEIAKNIFLTKQVLESTQNYQILD
jgi:hypothetical protein